MIYIIIAIAIGVGLCAYYECKCEAPPYRVGTQLVASRDKLDYWRKGRLVIVTDLVRRLDGSSWAIMVKDIDGTYIPGFHESEDFSLHVPIEKYEN